MKKWADFFRICPQFFQNEAIQEFECQNTKKTGFGIYGKTLYFFDPQRAKKPRKNLGFLGWHLF